MEVDVKGACDFVGDVGSPQLTAGDSAIKGSVPSPSTSLVQVANHSPGFAQVPLGVKHAAERTENLETGTPKLECSRSFLATTCEV